MNRGALGKLARTAAGWIRKVNLSSESRPAVLRDLVVSNSKIRKYGLSSDQKGTTNLEFTGIAELRWWEEDWKCRFRILEDCQNGVGINLGKNAVGNANFENADAFHRWQLDWRNKGRTIQPGMFSSMTPGLFGFHNVSSRRDCRDLPGLTIISQESSRGFAKATAVSPLMQKPVKLRLYMGSPGVIGEPYKKLPSLPFLKRWFTKEGWQRRKQSFMSMIKTSYTIAKLRQKTKGYSQQRFYQEVSDLYKQINVSLAEGERSQLRQSVTDSVFSIMKNELKHRETAWAKVTWEMVGPIKSIRTIQGRLVGIDKNNHDNAFVQLTLRILSKQKFAAYDRRGKLVAGDTSKELLVEDYWVFEKPLQVTDAKWRLCARLSV